MSDDVVLACEDICKVVWVRQQSVSVDPCYLRWIASFPVCHWMDILPDHFHLNCPLWEHSLLCSYSPWISAQQRQ